MPAETAATEPTQEDHMTATLPTCPREDCTFTGPHHDHNLTTGKVRDHSHDGDDCGHWETANYTRCYAPRTPQPQPAAVVLPTVDEVVDIIKEGGFYSDTARDILDLIAARLPVWQPIEPGTVIKAGTRVRRPYLTDSGAVEHILPTDTPANDEWFIDPRTVPAEPVDPRAELLAEELHNHGGCEEVWPCCSVSTVEHYRNDARDLLARLDAVGDDA